MSSQDEDVKLSAERVAKEAHAIHRANPDHSADDNWYAAEKKLRAEAANAVLGLEPTEKFGGVPPVEGELWNRTE